MYEDKIGNKLYRVKNNVVLHLISEDRKRKLGTINDDKKIFYTKRVYEKHLFRMNKSFGFNFEFLKSAYMLDTIELNTDRGEIFMIPLKFVIENGSFLHFKKQGFEKQIFIQLSQIEQFKDGNTNKIQT